MNPRHAFRPELAESVLENRTLPASFLASTFFQYSLNSGLSPFQITPPSANMLALTDPDLSLGALDMSFGGNADSYVSSNTPGSSYFGFGSNPFGSGLSPLSGVVEAYSQNTALSNILGGGSSIPGDGSLGDGFNLYVAGGNAALRAGAIGGPVNVTTAAGDFEGPRGYGATICSGFNFSLTSVNNYGATTNGIGTMSANNRGYAAYDDATGNDPANANGTGNPTGTGRGASNQPGTNRGKLGEGPINSQSKQPPSRRDPAPERRTAPPDAPRPAPVPPLPAPVESRGTEIVPTAPPVRDRREAPAAPDAQPPSDGPAAETILERVLRIPFVGTP